MSLNTSAAGKLTGGIISIAALAVILAAVNITASNMRLRADMTQEKLYSLSEGTRAVLKNLEAEVTLKFFFSSSSPEIPVLFKEFAGRIEDYLKEFSLASDGRVKIEKYDPKPDSDEEELAERYGIPGQPLGTGSADLYLGIAAVCDDSEEILPVIDPRTESTLEYQITRLIYRTANPRKPVAGIISSLPVLGSTDPSFMTPQGSIQQRPWLAFQELRQDCRLLELPDDIDAVDPEISTLVIVHPKNLSSRTLLAVDQFILNGGKALILLDPFCLTEAEASPSMGMGTPPSRSDIAPLLSAWNITFNPGQVLADLNAAARVNPGDGRIQENPMWLLYRGQGTSREDILTAGLEMLMLPFAGCFSLQTNCTLTVTPLITASEDSACVSSMMAQWGPDMLKREFTKTDKPLYPAVRISGRFKTAFPEGIEASPAGDEKTAAEPGSPNRIMPGLTEGDSSVILIADVDMFADRFCVEQLNFFGFQGFQPMNDNLRLLANAVEQLAGSPHLIGLRSRGKIERPFTRVLGMENTARKAWQEREDDLIQRLRAAQQRLNELQAQKDPNQKLIISPAQREAIASFQKEEAEIKTRLKEVKKQLRRDIDRLGLAVKIINIGAMPLLLGLAGIIYGAARKTAR